MLHRNPHAPSHLSVIVSRCLAKAPSERYESTRDLAHDLKDLLESASTQTLTREAPAPRRRPSAVAIAALAIAIAAAAGAAMWLGGLGRTEGDATNDEARRVVAVLPFRNLSADAAQNYFAAGMTEEIRGQLSKLGALRLLSRSAVDRFEEGDVKRLGSQLGAGSVVEGSVRLDKDRVRVAVELIDTGTEQTLWSEQYV